MGTTTFGREGENLAKVYLEKKGYKSLGLWTTGTVKKVFYHQPWDNIDGLTPEIMEDAAKMLYMGILSLSNDQTVKPTGIEK